MKDRRFRMRSRDTAKPTGGWTTRCAHILTLTWLLAAPQPTSAQARGTDATESAPTPATANDAPAPEEAEPSSIVSTTARESFVRGVAHSQAGEWQQAVEAFEQSLRAEDRPATRYNLVRANAELGRSLEVARHALAFLAQPRSPHRAGARGEVETLLAESLHSLSILDLTVTPLVAAVQVDGAPPELIDEAERIYLRPGVHAVDVRAAGHLPFHTEQLMPSGQVTTLAVALAPEPKTQAPIVKFQPRQWRRPLALTLASLGSAAWLSGLTSVATAASRRSALANTDPTMPGSLTRADRYDRLLRTSGPLTLFGGALAAGAGLVSAHAPARPWGWALLAAGAGLAAAGLTMALSPEKQVGDWQLPWPDRTTGFALLGAALPALGLGVRWLWLPREHAERSVSVGPLGVQGRF